MNKLIIGKNMLPPIKVISETRLLNLLCRLEMEMEIMSRYFSIRSEPTKFDLDGDDYRNDYFEREQLEKEREQERKRKQLEKRNEQIAIGLRVERVKTILETLKTNGIELRIKKISTNSYEVYEYLRTWVVTFTEKGKVKTCRSLEKFGYLF